MKRLIKYHSPYEETQFSTCSTKYEILDLVDDDYGYKELKALAEIHGFETQGRCFTPEAKRWGQKLLITESIKLTETIKSESFRETEEYPVYLGFIRIPEIDGIPCLETTNNKLTSEQTYDLANTQDAGIENIVSIRESGQHIVMSGWEFYHILPLNGYPLESVFEAAGTTETAFHDEVEFCGQCGEYDWRDDGHTYNHRAIGCEVYGTRCGCFDEFCKSPEALDEYADDSDKAMEPEAVAHHAETGALEFLERFVWGMTDSWRSHSYGGESVEISSPEDALAKYREKRPDSQFLFCHDESGQFQTYYSIYKIKGGHDE